MRAHGAIGQIPEAGRDDHVCWVYDDDAAFDRALADFLSGGLARGDRMLCVGERVIDSLPGLRLPSGDVRSLVAAGAVHTQTLAEAYEAVGPFSPESQLAYYEEATRRALEDGYRGLRVIAEISVLAADPGCRTELVRWEHVADDLIARTSGFTAMCAYRGDLPPEALADVAAVHPLVHAPDELWPFQVFFDDGRIVLSGSVDTFTAGRLARVLAASPARPDGVDLDLGQLEFADAAACRTIAAWARDVRTHGRRVTVHGAPPLFRRMWRILSVGELSDVEFRGPTG